MEANNCAACKQAITTPRLLKCVGCKAPYHPICVNAVTTDLSKLTDWLCPSCRAGLPKNCNLNTPVLTPVRLEVSNEKYGASRDSRAIKRMALGSPDQIRDSGEDKEYELADPIASELRLLRLDLVEIKTCLKLLTEGVSKCNIRLDSFEERIQSLEVKVPTISSLQETVNHLQDQLNHQAQTNLRNELEIVGINETSNESLEHIVMLTATKVGVNLPESEIDWVTRAGPKNGRDQPRPIIVRLTRKVKRDEVLKAAKLRRHTIITSADLDILGPPRKIYVNEHLSKLNRILFRDARLRAKELGFRFCWVNNGRVHLRREEGKPAIPIKSHADLDRILPTGPSRTSGPGVPF